MSNGNRIFRDIAIGNNRQRGPIIHQGNAVAVEDTTARRGSGDRTRLVLLRKFFIMVGRDHLHGPQLGDDGGEYRPDGSSEHLEPAIGRDTRGVALSLGGTGLRAILRIEGKPAVVTSQEKD